MSDVTVFDYFDLRIQSSICGVILMLGVRGTYDDNEVLANQSHEPKNTACFMNKTTQHTLTTM